MRTLIAVLALVCLLPLAAHAAIVEIHVTSAADSGPNTLRQAIIDGNALVATNDIPRILIDLDMYSPIGLTSPLPTVTSTYFEIRGTARSGARISGRGAHRILTTSPSVILLKIRNITFLHGYSTTPAAACLEMSPPTSGGFANVDDVWFDQCKQSTTGVANGSAIRTSHNLTIKGSVFNFNSSIGTQSAMGGAIAMFGDSDLIIRGSLFKNNVSESAGPDSTADGGAIYVGDGKSITIEDSEFTYNYVETPNNSSAGAQYGGAIFAKLTGKLSLLRTALYRNVAGKGGAIWYEGVYPGNPTVELRNVSAIDNQATRRSGGVLFSGNSQLILYNNTFWHNSAATVGDNLAAGVGTVLIAAAYNNLFAAGVGAGDSCSGFATAASGYNIVPAHECGFGVGGSDRITNDPGIRGLKFGIWMNYTVQLYSGSPALDAGNPMPPHNSSTGRCPTTDFLGKPRPVDASATGAPPRCDIGALEAQREQSLFIDDFDGGWLRP